MNYFSAKKKRYFLKKNLAPKKIAGKKSKKFRSIISSTTNPEASMFNNPTTMMPPPAPREPQKKMRRMMDNNNPNLYKGIMYNNKKYSLDPDRLVFNEPKKNPKNGSVSVTVKIAITVGNKEVVVPLEIQTPKMVTKRGYDSYAGDSKDGGNATFTSNTLSVEFDETKKNHLLFKQTMVAISEKCKEECIKNQATWFKGKVNTGAIECGFADMVRDSEMYAASMRYKIYSYTRKAVNGEKKVFVETDAFDVNGEEISVKDISGGSLVRCMFEFRQLYFGTTGVNIYTPMRLKQVKQYVAGAQKGVDRFIESDEEQE